MIVAAVKYGSKAAVFQVYFSPAAKSYVAVSRRLYPRRSRGLCFAAFGGKVKVCPHSGHIFYNGVSPRRFCVRRGSALASL